MNNQSNPHRVRGVGRALRVAASALLFTGYATVSTSADAADVCISPQAEATLKECPSGTMQATINKKPQVSFKSAPTAIQAKKRQDSVKPVNPSQSMNAAQRDQRRQGLAARSRQLLVTEIQGVETLLKSTPKKAADRPKLIRRLAEGYVELESAAFRDKTEAGMKADEAKRKNPKAAAGFETEAKKADQMLKLARTAAIKHYTSLKNEYPKWCQNNNAADPTKSTGCTDEVLYYLAYEYEQGNNLSQAQKVYYELIQKWPQSKYIPNAYLAFGELFFNEAQGDPAKWSLAEQSYKEVIKYPAPDNKVWGYAHYKLAYVAWNQEDFQRALSEFKKTIEYGMQYTQLPNAAQLAVSARKDIIPIYALSGDPKGAFNFFKPLSGDTGQSVEATLKMLRDLGQNYLDTGHYPEAITLYQDLMNRDKGSMFCEYQGHIAEATLAMKSGNKDAIKGQLDQMMSTHNKFLAQSQPEDAKLKCSNITAGLLSETAMAWHLEAVGTGGIRGTGDPKTMKLAADVYEEVVKNFTQAQFAKFTFPRIVKEDWPNIPKIKYAMADLLYSQKDWARCGPAFDAVVAEDPTGPDAPEAAYASVLCYQNIYTELHKGDAGRKGSGNLPNANDDGKKSDAAKFAPKDFTDNQKGMITAFNRYVCYIKPAATDKEATSQYVEVKYARARTYFEAQHWEEAAVAFRDIAINHADQDAGIYASQLYLESLNVLGSRVEPARTACFDNMAADVPKFLELYCKDPAKAKENSEQCGVLTKIQRDIERLRAQKLVEVADKGGPESLANYQKAGDAYVDLWKKYGEAPCRNKEAACERSEEILYNAAKAYQAARLVAKSIAVRRILINPEYNLQNTELARKSLYEIGGNYQAIAVYEEAANWYERFARENPKMEKAPDALQDAVVLRLGLGQEAQAIKDADLFAKNYGAKSPAQSAQIAFAIGAHYLQREDYASAQRRLVTAMPQIDRHATFDVQVQAHAMLGQVYDKTGSPSRATPEYAKVRNAWNDPTAAMKKLDAIGGDDATKTRRIGKVLTAVGEALFYFAEQKRATVDKITFPEYKGSGDRKEVEKHITTKVKAWIEKKRPAIEATEKEYLKILELQPAPPPQWVIAAGSRVGQMWGRFVAEFRSAPIPAQWKQKGDSPFGDPNDPSAPPLSWAEIRGAYYASLDNASEPQKQHAKGAYKKCLDYSVKFQYFDEYSRACEVWLSKNFGAEYHLVDELRGAPSLVSTGLNDKPAPLNIDGTLFVTVPPAAAAPEPAPEAAPAAGKPQAANDAAKK